MKITDAFTNGPLPYWARLAVGPANMDWSPGRIRFVVTEATGTQLANAEIGDYRLCARKTLPWRPPLRMIVRARWSHPAGQLAGTSGFGFWNNPFDLRTGEILAPPNALWFFCASPRSGMVAAPGLPGNGFRAETIRGGTVPNWLMVMANQLLKLPGLTRWLYRAAQTRVDAAAVRLDTVDLTEWHDYTLDWAPQEALFQVDGAKALQVARPTVVPLGFVAWMDNQVALARPEGEFRFGLQATTGQQWLDVSWVEIESQVRPDEPRVEGRRVSKNR